MSQRHPVIVSGSQCKSAFTLAEVLITLGIIGIVAAMTMPVILAKTKEQEALTGLKAANSILSQALTRATVDNGSYNDWTITETNMNDVFNNYVKPYLLVIVDCNTDKDSCWAETKALNGQVISQGAIDCIGGNTYSFVIKNGMNVCIDGWNHDSYVYIGVIENLPSNSVSFYVDVNGHKKPNQMGRDVFSFMLTKDGLKPGGSDNDSQGCTKNYLGYDCAAKFLRDGKYTY